MLWPSVGEYPIYDSFLYHVMTHDEVRNLRYRQAIAKLAPGKTAVDIGTGADLNWARACVAAGATKVFAIEEIEESFTKAERKLTELGLQNKIILLRGNSREVELTERVDVCVSEIIGAVGSSEGVCATLQDARERFMKPGAVMIPQRCATRVAAVTLPEPLHGDPSFGRASAKYVGPVLQSTGRAFDLRLCIWNFPTPNVLSSAGVFEDLSFDAAIPIEYEHRTTLEVNRSGRLDGLLLWLELWCEREGDKIDTLAEQTNWIPQFFPVFYPGISVRQGDRLYLTCTTRLSDDGHHPDYRVRCEVFRGTARAFFEFRSPHHGNEFKAGSFHRALFS